MKKNPRFTRKLGALQNIPYMSRLYFRIFNIEKCIESNVIFCDEIDADHLASFPVKNTMNIYTIFRFAVREV